MFNIGNYKSQRTSVYEITANSRKSKACVKTYINIQPIIILERGLNYTDWILCREIRHKKKKQVPLIWN